MTRPPLPPAFEPGARWLAGRSAVVTGGGGAICGAVAEAFALHGAEVVVVADAHAERTAEVAARVEAAGSRAVPVVVDLASREGMAFLVAEASAAVPEGIDVLVNGLGDYLGIVGPFEDGDEDGWQALYEVNLLHVLRASQAFIPAMKAKGWGRIINFSSVEGIRAAPGLAAYTAFKAAVDGFTKCLGVDLAVDGIRVNAIAVDKTRSVQVPGVVPPGYEHLVPAWIPAGRFGEPPDVAAVALFLASDLSDWMTGTTVVADGGTIAAGGWHRTPTRWTSTPLLVQYLEDPATNAERPPSLQ